MLKNCGLLGKALRGWLNKQGTSTALHKPDPITEDEIRGKTMKIIVFLSLLLTTLGYSQEKKLTDMEFRAVEALKVYQILPSPDKIDVKEKINNTKAIISPKGKGYDHKPVYYAIYATAEKKDSKKGGKKDSKSTQDTGKLYPIYLGGEAHKNKEYGCVYLVSYEQLKKLAEIAKVKYPKAPKKS